MSLNNPIRKWRRFWAVPAVALVTMAAAAASATASGRMLPAHAMLPASAVAAGANAELGAGPAAGQVLGGLTSQGWPVVMQVSQNGKRIDDIVIGLDMRCTSGETFSTQDGFVHLRIGPTGQVRGAVTVPPSSQSGSSFAGATQSLTGKLNRKRATFSGAWRLHVMFSLSNGQTDTCDSGRVTFAARL